MLRKIHKQECKVEEPWWRKVGGEAEYHSQQRDVEVSELEAEDYEAGRQTYLKETGKKPPCA